jgi:hypothetical protein
VTERFLRHSSAGAVATMLASRPLVPRVRRHSERPRVLNRHGHAGESRPFCLELPDAFGWLTDGFQSRLTVRNPTRSASGSLSPRDNGHERQNRRGDALFSRAPGTGEWRQAAVRLNLADLSLLQDASMPGRMIGARSRISRPHTGGEHRCCRGFAGRVASWYFGLIEGSKGRWPPTQKTIG